MQILNGLDSLPAEPLEPVLTMGTFDGVHRGHQAILGRIKQESERMGVPNMVLTFYPHPRQFLRPNEPFHPIMSLRERIRRLWDVEMDYALVVPFDADLAEMTAEEFVHEILWDTLRVSAVHVGPFTTFGHDRAGDVKYLQSVGRQLGFHVGVVDPVVIGGTRVSSSRIRAAIAQGHLEEATRLLGRHHRLSGEVIPGDARGRELGYPTANIAYDGCLLPPPGVYTAWATLEDESRHPAVMNLGVRPTFEGMGLAIEAHLLDFEGDLYGQELICSLVGNIRAEVKFADARQLKRQIKKDVEEARRQLGLPERRGKRAT